MPEISEEEFPPKGLIVPLDVTPNQGRTPAFALPKHTRDLKPRPYSSERQRDWVRLIVTCGMLIILGYVIVFATVESTSWPSHWTQAKEMLQIILPALTGIIGTVIGFYFGTAAAINQKQPPNDNDL